MNIKRPISGMCPTQGKKYVVTLTCIPVGDGSYIKGTITCPYTKQGGICNETSCPIREKHPENFY